MLYKQFLSLFFRYFQNILKTLSYFWYYENGKLINTIRNRNIINKMTKSIFVFSVKRSSLSKTGHAMINNSIIRKSTFMNLKSPKQRVIYSWYMNLMNKVYVDIRPINNYIQIVMID